MLLFEQSVLLLLFWHLLFLSTELLPLYKTCNWDVKIDTKVRIIQAFHGIVSHIVAAYMMLTVTTPYDAQNSYSQNLLMTFSFTFAIYDQLCCMYYKISNTMFNVHHFCMISLTLFTLISNSSGRYGAQVLFFTEIPNWALHLRASLKNHGYRYTKFYEYVETYYFVIYILFRGIFINFSAMHGFLDPHVGILAKFSGLGLHAQSYYFIIGMVKLLKRKLKNHKMMKEKKIEFEWFKPYENLNQLFFMTQQKVKVF